MIIKKFKDFISEKFIPQMDDIFAVASDKNYFNDEELLIQKFVTWKVEMENIYKSYLNETDLINKLFNKGFIKEKTKSPKKKLFKNKYLGMWAEICDKKRKLEDIEKISRSNQKDMQTYNQEVVDNKGNDTVTDYAQDKAEDTNKRLDDNQSKIEDLQMEIINLDKQLKKDFELMKKKHKLAKAKLASQQSMKKTNSPQEEEEEEEKDKG
jgi:hypothetical protein